MSRKRTKRVPVAVLVKKIRRDMRKLAGKRREKKVLLDRRFGPRERPC